MALKSALFHNLLSQSLESGVPESSLWGSREPGTRYSPSSPGVTRRHRGAGWQEKAPTSQGRCGARRSGAALRGESALPRGERGRRRASARPTLEGTIAPRIAAAPLGQSCGTGRDEPRARPEHKRRSPRSVFRRRRTDWGERILGWFSLPSRCF